MMTNRPFENLPERLAQTASLHPETVANAAIHAKAFKPKRKYTRKPKYPPVLDTAEARLHAEVLETAKKLAGGDMRRVQFLPDGSAIVHNHPYRPVKPQDNR
jgi:hypothetical protein